MVATRDRHGRWRPFFRRLDLRLASEAKAFGRIGRNFSSRQTSDSLRAIDDETSACFFATT